MKKFESQFKLLRITISIVSALLLAFIIIIFTSSDPMNAIYDFIVGPLTSVRRLGNIVELMIPLLFTGVGVSIMYSANQINLSSEGAFFLGAVAASYVAVTFILPSGIHPIVAILAGGFVGAIVSSIPAVLYLRFG